MRHRPSMIFIILLCTISLFASARVITKNIDNPYENNGEFWKKNIIYQIYPRSFYDSDGDGIGDLKGITSKANYLWNLGVGIIWLSPIFPSPMADFGYDVSNYTDVDPIFGDLQDFDDLVNEMHTRGLRVVLDFVPNHSSNQHEWFIKSVQKDPFYKDFYVWKDPLSYNETGHPVPPNNWLSAFRYSAWEWSEERKQFYYHAFLKEQPDLNYRNPAVVEEMKKALSFWMDRGVDGFRLDAVAFLIEVDDVNGNNEPVASNSSVTDETEFDYLNHTLITNQPETFEVLRGFKEVADSYGDKVVMAEVFNEDMQQYMRYYGNMSDPVTDFPFNFHLLKQLKSRKDVTGTNLRAIIDLWLDNLPEGKWPNWILGNHDNARVGTRLGKELIDALNMLTLMLPGTPITYYGEEIGMLNTNVSYEEAQDPYGCVFGPERYLEFDRDPERTPMQWNESDFAGFTDGNTTWLPVNTNYKELNVEIQNTGNESSLQLYSYLAILRQRPVFQMGRILFVLATQDTLAFIRAKEQHLSYLVVINTSLRQTEVNLVESGNITLPETGIAVLRSSSDNRLETAPGAVLQLSRLPLEASEGMVLLLIATY